MSSVEGVNNRELLLTGIQTYKHADMQTYNDFGRDACVDGHPDAQAPEQQLALWARLKFGLWMLQEFRGPRGLQHSQLDMKGPAYGVKGVVKGDYEGVAFCCHLQAVALCAKG